MTQIERNKIKILNLLNRNIDLEHKQRIRRFKKTYEKLINGGTKKQPHWVNAKFGMWYEYFEDEETGKKNKNRKKYYL